MTATPRIALVHATPLAIEPINDAFKRLWPRAQRMNLLDDSLSQDRARDGSLTGAMVQRFVDLATYAKGTGCNAILFTCSAFGPAIEAASGAVEIPALKPNEAMFGQALGLRRAQPDAPVKLALIATFQPSIDPMAEELRAMARAKGVEVDLRTEFVPGAMQDLAEGRAQDHHQKIAMASLALADCDAIMLAQFSMAAAQPVVQQQLRCKVLTSPECAVEALRGRLIAASPNRG